MASIVLGLLVFAPLYTTQSGETKYSVYAAGLLKESPELAEPEVVASQPAMIAVDFILVILCIVAIFMFKNRRMQKRLASSLMISSTVFVILLSANSNELMKSVPGYSGEGNYGWGLILPFVAVVFLLLANRGIRKDEELVKSADRLR